MYKNHMLGLGVLAIAVFVSMGRTVLPVHRSPCRRRVPIPWRRLLAINNAIRTTGTATTGTAFLQRSHVGRLSPARMGA